MDTCSCINPLLEYFSPSSVEIISSYVHNDKETQEHYYYKATKDYRTTLFYDDEDELAYHPIFDILVKYSVKLNINSETTKNGHIFIYLHCYFEGKKIGVRKFCHISLMEASIKDFPGSHWKEYFQRLLTKFRKDERSKLLEDIGFIIGTPIMHRGKLNIVCDLLNDEIRRHLSPYSEYNAEHDYVNISIG